MTKHILTLSAIFLQATLMASANPRDLLPALPVISNPSLSLAAALGIARANNVSLAQAHADAAVAVAEEKIARAQRLPSLSTTTYATVGDSSNIITSSPDVMPQNYFSIPSRGFADQDLMLMVPIYTGGKLRKNVDAAQAEGQAAGLAVKESGLSLTAMLTNDYANAALGQSLVDTAQSALTAENEQVRETEEKVSNGALAPVDLLREQAAQEDAQQSLLAAQNSAALAMVALKTEMGVSQTSTIALSDTLDMLSAALPSAPSTLDAALAQGEATRPELAAAEREVSAAQAMVGAAEGSSAPQVYGVAMGDAMSGQDMNRLGYTVGVTVSAPIYDGGSRSAAVEQAKAHLKRVQADAQQVRQSVDADIASAWLTLQTASAQITSATAGVAAAKADYTLAALRYSAGKSTTLDRLDALSALTHAEGALAEAKAGLITASANLQETLGSAI